MFATLLGPLPRPPVDADAAPLDVLIAVLRAQEAARLDPVTDGGFGIGDSPAERWRATADRTDRTVKQAVLGPYSQAWAALSGGPEPAVARRQSPPDASVLADAALAATERLRGELRDLAAAGCPMIEIHEPAATLVGGDEARWELLREAHRRLVDGLAGTHLSLAITGGNADPAGAATLLAAPYASLAVDLIAGPENWRLIAAAPGERGIVCGAVSAERDADDRPEILLWAAGYAASMGGRGPSRVGLATASSLAGLAWDVALRKVAVLGEALRLADLSPEERRLELDPRAVDSRSAALGRVEPRRTVRRRSGASGLR